MQIVEAPVAISVEELIGSPAAMLDMAQDAAIAVLDRNRIRAYLISAEAYEAMLEKLDDQDLAEIAAARLQEVGRPVSLDDL